MRRYFPAISTMTIKTVRGSRPPKCIKISGKSSVSSSVACVLNRAWMFFHAGGYGGIQTGKPLKINTFYFHRKEVRRWLFFVLKRPVIMGRMESPSRKLHWQYIGYIHNHCVPVYNVCLNRASPTQRNTCYKSLPACCSYPHCHNHRTKVLR